MQNITQDGKKYVAERIGEEYRTWEFGDTIFITAPTGSGKSFFVFHKLLKYAVDSGRRILYLVNRKVLKRQLEESLYELSFELFDMDRSISVRDYISIRTYQSLETEIIKKGDGQLGDLRKEIGAYQYVVYDEAHYFYADANFNTNTQIGFDFLRRLCDDRIQIYMSATIEKVADLIKNRKAHFFKWDGQKNQLYVKAHDGRTELRYLYPKVKKIHEYFMEKQYSYVQLWHFDNRDEIENIVRDQGRKKEKWLIFTDNIEFGKELRRKLISDLKGREDATVFEEKDVVFIDANYGRDSDARESVEQLSRERYMNQKVVITTAVMDNGISFHDNALRNIVILSDTEEEFVQMLGRKRTRGESINVFVCKRSVEYFNQRLQFVDAIIKKYDRYKRDIDGMYRLQFPAIDIKGEECADTYPIDLCFDLINSQNCIIGQQRVLADMLSNKNLYKALTNFCYFFRGMIAINYFSIQRLLDLRNFYTDLTAKLKENENAFLEQQARWLNFSDEEIEEFLKRSTLKAGEAYCEQIRSRLEKELEKNLSKEDTIAIKKDLKDALKFFLPSDYYNEEKDCIVKTDRALKSEVFNRFMQEAALPYRMSKVDRSTFMISR